MFLQDKRYVSFRVKTKFSREARTLQSPQPTQVRFHSTAATWTPTSAPTPAGPKLLNPFPTSVAAFGGWGSPPPHRWWGRGPADLGSSQRPQPVRDAHGERPVDAAHLGVELEQVHQEEDEDDSKEPQGNHLKELEGCPAGPPTGTADTQHSN